MISNKKGYHLPHLTGTARKFITLIEISNGMKYLHERGIIHRDLKPENVPRICDFGSSRSMPKLHSKSSKLTMTGKIGTPLYMAPEILKGKTNYNETVDVYAFAIIMYEIVTLKVPFSELGEIELCCIGNENRKRLSSTVTKNSYIKDERFNKKMLE